MPWLYTHIRRIDNATIGSILRSKYFPTSGQYLNETDTPFYYKKVSVSVFLCSACIQFYNA
jgi:hypothetical protein